MNMSTIKISETNLFKAGTKFAMALAASILLSACGSGGGGDSAPAAASNNESQSPSEVVDQAPQQVAPVQIFTHPQAITVNAGQHASFSVAASGGGSLSYQWLRNGQAIQGAITNSLVLSNTTQADAAVYSVRVSNSANAQTSLSALLTVNVSQTVVDEPALQPVVIVAQPQSVSVNENDNATFNVQASGDGQISYQWLKDGAIIEGATSATLSLASVGLNDAANYSVMVNLEVSNAAVLNVNAVKVAKSIALSWDMPQEREDGSALESFEINGYVIAYGTDANNLNQQVAIEGASVLATVLDNMSAGTYYFAIATIDSEGSQGAYSDTITQSI